MKLRNVITIFGLGLVGTVLISGCGKADKKPAIPQINWIPVVSQTVAKSRAVEQTLSFPALVTAKEQATVLAKSSGTAKMVAYQLGDPVKAGDLMLKIDDVTGTSYNTGFNAGPVNQAKLAAEHAGNFYESARIAYENLLTSSQKDLNQANIALNQAETSRNNTQEIAADSLKSAQIAYDMAKLAAAQAALALENREAGAEQAEADVAENADLAATSVMNAANTIITGVNTLTGFDESNSVAISYENYLGARDAFSLYSARNLYKGTKEYYENFLEMEFKTTSKKVSETFLLAGRVKELVDAVKLLFDNTITGTLLPQSSVTGVSLNSLQSVVVGYQTQINAALTQIQSANQALVNTELNNSTSLDALEKAYELAQQQEKAALQNLSNLKTSTQNQLDQMGFGEEQASNLYENTKIKLDSQLAGAKTQMDNARLQYENALIALNSLTNNYQLVAPISGTITQKSVAEGDTISPGQLLFTISRAEAVKIQFYVDQFTLGYLGVGMPVRVTSNNGQDYEAVITALGMSADSVTKRFLVEAEPRTETPGLVAGTVADVNLTITITPEDSTNILLPISAVEVTPNGSSIYVNEGDRAKQVAVTVVQIRGESAELKTQLSDSAQVIVDGNRLLHEGDYLTEKSE